MHYCYRRIAAAVRLKPSHWLPRLVLAAGLVLPVWAFAVGSSTDSSLRQGASHPSTATAIDQSYHRVSTPASAVSHPLINKQSLSSASQVAATTVKVGQVKLQDVPEMVPSLGTLAAIQIASLSALADGQVTNIYFKNGQDVAQGMPVLQLDDSQQKADMDKAKTDLALAELKYERSKQLQNESISAQAIAALKATVDKFKASKSAAFASLEQMKVTAPFSGTLGAFKVNVGDYVSQGATLVKLINNKQLRVDFSVPEIYKPKLQTGQMVKVTSAAYPKKTFIGTVNYVSPTVQADTRTVSLQALLPNPKDLLSPGMFVKALLKVGVLKNVMVVPDQAISADIKGYYVYKVVGTKVKKVYVQVGQRTADDAQIKSGLKKGDQVVTAGQQKLEDGAQISVVLPSKKKTAPAVKAKPSK